LHGIGFSEIRRAGEEWGGRVSGGGQAEKAMARNTPACRCTTSFAAGRLSTHLPLLVRLVFPQGG
jgi:hypothetical protein